ncbi:MAG TPA: PDZ domain-containing protein [Phycisphaerae bacterium]|nr:PDZ domain-containing protein [Phycisphaerae bacterium]
MRPAGAFWLIALAATLAAQTRPAPPSASRTTQPAEINRLVEQMGSSDYKSRQEAYERLHQMGPGILDLIYPYRNHADPEIQTRVRELILSYRWLTRGAMIVKIQPNSQAERLGFQPGDVVVRMNDRDITGQEEIPFLRATSDRTLLIWRFGKLREVAVAPGTIGFYSTNWDLTHGGENQSAGFAALHSRRYDEAYARLDQAAREDMEDTWGLVALAGAAEYCLDHTRAMEVYERHLRNHWYFHDQSEMNLLETHFGLPLSALQTAVLLEQIKAQAAGESQIDQLRTHLVGRGRNWLLAKEIKRPASARPDYASLYLALREGRMEQAVKDYAASGKDTHSASLAVQAAVRRLDVKAACDVAWELVLAYVERNASAEQAAVSLWALAEAAADGQNDQVSRLLPNSTGLDRFVALLEAGPPQWRSHVAVASRMAPFLVAKAGDIHLLSDPGRRAFVRHTMDLLSLNASSHAEDWDRTAQAFNLQAVRGAEVEALHTRFLLRHALFAQARIALDRAERASPPPSDDEDDPPAVHPRSQAAAKAERQAMRRALDFLSANQGRLSDQWAQLKGTFYLYPARHPGSQWAVRWDGRTFLIDAEGHLRDVPGLAPGQAHLADEGDRIFATARETLCLRRGQIYLLDEQAGRWQPTYAGAGDSPTAEKIEAAPGLDLALRHVVDKYPSDGPGRELWAHSPGPGAWQCFQFGRNLALAVHVHDGRVLDVSRQVGSQSGHDKPAAVYRALLSPDAKYLYLPTDRGLWTLDKAGKLERVDLAGAPADATVVILPRPEKKDKLYAGLPPQQGGKVYEVDLATLKAQATKGYCAWGPDEYDPFALADVHMGYAVQTVYERRQASR